MNNKTKLKKLKAAIRTLKAVRKEGKKYYKYLTNLKVISKTNDNHFEITIDEGWSQSV